MTPVLRLVKDELLTVPEISSFLSKNEFQAFDLTVQSYLSFWLLKNFPERYQYVFHDKSLSYFTVLGYHYDLLATNFSIESKDSRSDSWSLVQTAEKDHMESLVDLICPKGKSSSIPTISQTDTTFNLTMSVVIPTTGRTQYLSSALNGLAMQIGAPKFEVVIGIDGKSPTEFKEVELLCLKFKEVLDIKLFQFSFSGAAGTRNRIVENCSYEYLVFLDDDNIPKSEMLKNFSKLSQSPFFQILVSPHEILFSSEIESLKKTWIPLGGSLKLATFHNVLGDMNLCIRKSDFQKIGGLDCSANLSCEDWDFLFRAMLEGYKIGVLPEISQSYFARSDSFYRRSNRVISASRILGRRAKHEGLSSTLELEVQRAHWS